MPFIQNLWYWMKFLPTNFINFIINYPKKKFEFYGSYLLNWNWRERSSSKNITRRQTTWWLSILFNHWNNKYLSYMLLKNLFLTIKAYKNGNFSLWKLQLKWGKDKSLEHTYRFSNRAPHIGKILKSL